MDRHTAFTGDLALPLDTIRKLGLTRTSTVLAVLADGSTHKVESYIGFADWFGEVREVEIVAGQNPIPLLGVTLLLGCRLEIDYSSLTVCLIRVQ